MWKGGKVLTLRARHHGPSGRGVLRHALARIAVGLAVLVLMATVTAACGAKRSALPQAAVSPTVGSAQSREAAPAADPAAAEALQSVDWKHVLQVVADLRADPPAAPLVLMLGGSAVRESTSDDASWTAQVQRLGGRRALAYNLGSGNQSFAQDLQLVPYLPSAATIVLIGINLGRFVESPAQVTVHLPRPKPVPANYQQDRYRGVHTLSTARKRALVTDWMAERYPLFSANYADDLALLEELVKACRAHGLHPVLLDAPRDTIIVSRALAGPIDRYLSDVRSLARRDDIPFVDIVPEAHLTNADFLDLWHVVAPGRKKWQAVLSRETVKLLRRYGMAQ